MPRNAKTTNNLGWKEGVIQKHVYLDPLSSQLTVSRARPALSRLIAEAWGAAAAMVHGGMVPCTCTCSSAGYQYQLQLRLESGISMELFRKKRKKKESAWNWGIMRGLCAHECGSTVSMIWISPLTNLWLLSSFNFLSLLTHHESTYVHRIFFSGNGGIILPLPWKHLKNLGQFDIQHLRIFTRFIKKSKVHKQHLNLGWFRGAN